MPKILLVEDNEMNRDMLSRRLQRKGYEVAIAVDGLQGVEMGRSGESACGARCRADTDHRAYCTRDGGRSRKGSRGRLR